MPPRPRPPRQQQPGLIPFRQGTVDPCAALCRHGRHGRRPGDPGPTSGTLSKIVRRRHERRCAAIPTPSAGGSREARRARIEHTALELFRVRGFDQVTVEDVCAVAGVAPATFYRHFGTKEEVVFAYRDAFTAALREALAAASEVPESDRLLLILGRFAAFLETQQELLAVRDEIVMGHRGLMQRTLSEQRELEATLASGLARLRGGTEPDVTALLEAGAGIVALRVAFRSWRAGQEDSLPVATHHALVRLRRVLSSQAAGSE